MIVSHVNYVIESTDVMLRQYAIAIDYAGVVSEERA